MKKKGPGGKWEQNTEREAGRSQREDAAAVGECWGKGQLPFQHFALTDQGNRGLDKSPPLSLFTDMSRVRTAGSINGLRWGRETWCTVEW